MTETSDRRSRTAVLIDADNASPKAVESLFDRDPIFGDATVRRIYGDFSRPNLKGWIDVIAKHAIVPKQNFAVTVAKNATDIALVIDAMDLVHSGRCELFCLVSSDSDFMPLATRIREQGMDVYGYGESKTPDHFRKACKLFTILSADPERRSVATDRPCQVTDVSTGASANRFGQARLAVGEILAAIAQSKATDGWYHLGNVGSCLNALSPGFRPKRFGSPNLSTLVEQTGAFDLLRRDLSVYLRPKSTPID